MWKLVNLIYRPDLINHKWLEWYYKLVAHPFVTETRMLNGKDNSLVQS